MIFIVGVVFVTYPILKLKLSRDVRSWPTVKGLIIELKISELFSRGGPQGPAYRPILKYKYEVDGIEMFGSRIGICDTKYEGGAGTRVLVEDEAERNYGEGKHVTVYYHPQQPRISLLDRKLSGWQKIKYVVSIIFGFCLAVVAVYLLTSYL